MNIKTSVAAFILITATSWGLAADQDTQTKADQDTEAKVDQESTADSLEVKLQSINDQIETLEEKIKTQWEDLSDHSRKKLQETLAALKESRIQLKEWLNQASKHTAHYWENLKESLSSEDEETPSETTPAVKTYSI